MPIKIVTFTGSSGSGKTTTAGKLIKENNFEFVLSNTTRKPRPSDLNGEYNYLSEDQFNRFEQTDKFAWAVYEHRIYYGTLKESLDEALINSYYSMMILTPKGVINLRNYCKDQSLNIYLTCNPEILRERLINRSERDIEKRLTDCLEWEEQARNSDIPYHFISNDGKIESTVEIVKDTIKKYS